MRFGAMTVEVRDGVVRREDGVLAGSALTMADAVRNVHALGVPLDAALRAAGEIPARVLARPARRQARDRPPGRHRRARRQPRGRARPRRRRDPCRLLRRPPRCPRRARSSWRRSASNPRRCDGSSSRSAAIAAAADADARARQPPRASRRARLLRQRRVVRRLRVRPACPRLTAVRDSISLTVHYRTGLDMAGETAIGLSQSGRTPDVVDYLERARANGALTIALTNDPGSELARAADAVVPLCAGDEQAVAATKTYLTTVAALALLAGNIAGEGARIADGRPSRGRRSRGGDPGARARGCGARRPVRLHGTHVRHRPRCRVRDRARDRAQAARDLLRRRRAADRRPTWRTARSPRSTRCSPSGRSRPPTRCCRPCRRLPTGSGPWVRPSSPAARRPARSRTPPTRCRCPQPEPPLLSPLLSVVPGQLFAWALARAKGLDPDRPRGLSKITLAR